MSDRPGLGCLAGVAAFGVALLAFPWFLRAFLWFGDVYGSYGLWVNGK